MDFIRQSKKAWAPLFVAVPAWGAVAQIRGIDGVEWWGLAGIIGGAVLAWMVPNDQP